MKRLTKSLRPQEPLLLTNLWGSDGGWLPIPKSQEARDLWGGATGWQRFSGHEDHWWLIPCFLCGHKGAMKRLTKSLSIRPPEQLLLTNLWGSDGGLSIPKSQIARDLWGGATGWQHFRGHVDHWWLIPCFLSGHKTVKKRLPLLSARAVLVGTKILVPNTGIVHFVFWCVLVINCLIYMHLWYKQKVTSCKSFLLMHLSSTLFLMNPPYTTKLSWSEVLLQ